jgi:hypothetical protein
MNAQNDQALLPKKLGIPNQPEDAGAAATGDATTEVLGIETEPPGPTPDITTEPPVATGAAAYAGAAAYVVVGAAAYVAGAPAYAIVGAAAYVGAAA